MRGWYFLSVLLLIGESANAKHFTILVLTTIGQLHFVSITNPRAAQFAVHGIRRRDFFREIEPCTR